MKIETAIFKVLKSYVSLLPREFIVKEVKALTDAPVDEISFTINLMINEGWLSLSPDGKYIKVTRILEPAFTESMARPDFEFFEGMPSGEYPESWFNENVTEIARRYQRNRSTCVGCSAAMGRDLDYLRITGKRADDGEKAYVKRQLRESNGIVHDVLYPWHSFSAECIYQWSREFGKVPDGTEGSTLSAAMDALRKRGGVLEKDWYTPAFEYPPRLKGYPLTYDALVGKAASHKIDGYKALRDFEQIKQAIYTYGYVLMPILIYPNYLQASKVSFPEPVGNPIGSHAMCFTKDTKVALLNGEELDFETLVTDYKNTPFWVYSCDINGNIVPGRAHSPRLTKRDAEIIKVLLDSGDEIKCTSDHLFLMRDGTYKEARYLVTGDSLMPLYRKTDKKGYEICYNPATNSWHPTHRLIANRAISSEFRGQVIHHIDFNKHNNDPDNLRIMSWDEHTKLHADNSQLLVNYTTSDIGREMSRELMKNNWNSDEWRERLLPTLSKNGTDISHRLRDEGRLGFQTWSHEDLVENGLKNKDRLKGISKSADHNAKNSAAQRSKFDTDPIYRKRKQDVAQNNLLEYNAKINSGEIALTDNQINARRLNALKCCYARYYKDKYPTFEEWLDNRGSPSKIINHKVVSITSCGKEDVYDLSVDRYHNFALSSGVFVHNCWVGYGKNNLYCLHTWDDWAYVGFISKEYWEQAAGTSFAVIDSGEVEEVSDKFCKVYFTSNVPATFYVNNLEITRQPAILEKGKQYQLSATTKSDRVQVSTLYKPYLFQTNTDTMSMEFPLKPIREMLSSDLRMLIKRLLSSKEG